MRAVRLNAWKSETGLHVDAGLMAGDIAGRAVITPFTEYEPDA